MRRLMVAAALFALIAAPGTGAASDDALPGGSAGAAGAATDINMVVALDRSESISLEEAAQQIEGLAHALRDPRFAASVSSGWEGRIGISVVTWSSFGKTRELVPWTVLTGREDALGLAAVLERQLDNPPLLLDGSQTDLALGIRTANKALRAAPFPTVKEVINIVSDGISNIGNVPNVARDAAVGEGVVINALTMAKGSAIAVMRRYYERNVIGGPSSFVHNTTTNGSVSDAMLRKMLLEIALLNAD